MQTSRHSLSISLQPGRTTVGSEALLRSSASSSSLSQVFPQSMSLAPPRWNTPAHSAATQQHRLVKVCDTSRRWCSECFYQCCPLERNTWFPFGPRSAQYCEVIRVNEVYNDKDQASHTHCIYELLYEWPVLLFFFWSLGHVTQFDLEITQIMIIDIESVFLLFSWKVVFVLCFVLLYHVVFCFLG